MNLKKAIFALALAALPLAGMSGAEAAEYQQTQDGVKVIEHETTPRLMHSPNFTGQVHHQSVFGVTPDTTYTGSYVYFAPGARSNWHTHPGGQRLMVVKGTAWTQVWNGPKTVAHEGDTIWCPPGVKHWHGASAEEGLVQLTFTEVRDGKNVTWMEPVTDEQYNSK